MSDTPRKSLLSTLVEQPAPPSGTAAIGPSLIATSTTTLPTSPRPASELSAGQPPTLPPIMDGDYEIDVLPYHGDYDPNARFFLSYFWERLQSDGLLDLYFPGAGDKSYCTFVKLFSSNTRVLIVVRRVPHTREVLDTVGFATWDPMHFGPSMVGHAGFIFLKEYWNKHTTIAAAHRIERFWFEETPPGEPRMDIALGIIAEDNRLAQRFMHNLGWIQAGVLPQMQEYAGKPSNATIWYLTRTMFEQQQQETR